MSIDQIAFEVFDACETGKGWAACKAHCTDTATFSCQASALADITTLAAYCGWMQNLLIPLPDGRYELTGFATDTTRKTVLISAIFRGTHSVDVGDGAPTGKMAESDYAYILRFEGDKIVHMAKIWNDVHALHQLGWG